MTRKTTLDTLDTLARVATTLVLLGSGLACEIARIAAPPADRVQWKVRGEGYALVPSFDSATVYFASRDHNLVAVDRRSGAVRWKAATDMGSGGGTGGENSVVAGDVVVLGDGNVYAFDRETGARAWTFAASDFDVPGSGALATDGTSVYAGSFLGRVYALDAHTGATRWTTQLPALDGGQARAFSPVVKGGRIYVGLDSYFQHAPTLGALAALDAITGRLLWVRPFASTRDFGSLCTGDAVVVAGLVIASAGDGRIYGLDTVTGDVRWVAPPVPNYPTGDDRALAVSNNLVLATSNSGIATALDVASGTTRWYEHIDGDGSLGMHIAADATLAIFTSGSNEVVAVDPQTGSVRWGTGIGKEGGDFWGYAALAPDAVFANGIEAFYALKR